MAATTVSTDLPEEEASPLVGAESGLAADNYVPITFVLTKNGVVSIHGLHLSKR
jgi:hypothetical protein